MKKKLKYLLPAFVAGLLLLFAACENEISYNRETFKPELTLNAFINADSLTNRLSLTFTGRTQISPAYGVTVEVAVNGETQEVLETPEPNSGYTSYVDITTRFRPGDRVRIDARTADGVHHAWVEETVPHPVEILQVDTFEIPLIEDPGSYYKFKYLQVKVRFRDRPNEKNYYRLVLEQKHHLTETNDLGEDVVNSTLSYGYWTWEDLALTDGRPIFDPDGFDNALFERVTNYYGIFNDNWFKDDEYTLNVKVSFYEPRYITQEFIPKILNADLTVKLLTITEAEYSYLTTMNILESDILEEYLSDPVIIPSNVHGGTGCVCISSGHAERIAVYVDKELEVEEPDWWLDPDDE